MMTVRRADALYLKPGRFEDYRSQFVEFKGVSESHGAQNVSLIRLSSGEPGPETFTAFADWESMADYGSFLDAVTKDEKVQRLYRAFFEEDSPINPNGTSILIKQTEMGSPEPFGPGAVGLVRSWKLRMWQSGALIEVMDAIARYHDGTKVHHALWQLWAAGRGSGQYLTASVFPSMADLGKFVDRNMSNPDELARIIAPIREADPPIEMVGNNIWRMVNV